MSTSRATKINTNRPAHSRRHGRPYVPPLYCSVVRASPVPPCLSAAAAARAAMPVSARATGRRRCLLFVSRCNSPKFSCMRIPCVGMQTGAVK
ncbi:hypothetical protein JTE90_016983 [Oedothorax gibbosus]|uniref:Uncharacterized protein n=1 Tax=Oedothorax gibbosus TaxID=931172 RepID=A0AAV6TLW0_9ARAC|nr:hypothetical protein JTE90_016983 [Oedothorax gibbosus]